MTTKKPCPECNDTGWRLKDSKDTKVAVRCACYEEQKHQVLFDQAGIPKRYTNCSFTNFEIHNDSHKHTKKISQKFVKDYPALNAGLLFIGPCGVGKTHLAVAIKYDSAVMVAPKVLAKGAGDIAQRIKDIAEKHGVPIVENKELARNLYSSVEVDQEIPSVFYQAVAEILAYIYRLKGRQASGIA